MTNPTPVTEALSAEAVGEPKLPAISDTELDAVAVYRDALSRGLSDAEAREEGWPTLLEARGSR